MKYFTPQLVEMGLASDDATLNEQERLWDEAGDRYVAHLDSVRPQMPAGLAQLDRDYYLHDALVCGMGQANGAFVIVLRIDAPPRSLLSLHYDLVESPVIEREALSPELCSPNWNVQWQYDEIEHRPGSPPAWAQSILLSNGWEIRLTFRDVKIEEMPALLPEPAESAA